MKPPPLVAVVIPAWNAERYLPLTVASVRGQTMPDWELVVVDDGSADGTAASAQRAADGDVRIRVVCQENRGVAWARNRGATASHPGARYITFLDNDDVWEPRTLEVLLSALGSDPMCVSAHGLVRCVDAEGQEVAGDDIEDALRQRRAAVGGRVVAWPADARTTFAVLAVENCIVSPGAQLVRREAFAAIGGFDPDTVPCDDWDMSLRLSRLGDIAYVDRPLLRWRRHPGNASALLSRRWRRAYFTTRRKLVACPANTPEQRSAALVGFRLACTRPLREAVDAVRRGRPGEAARLCIRSAYAWSQYARSAR